MRPFCCDVYLPRGRSRLASLTPRRSRLASLTPRRCSLHTIAVAMRYKEQIVCAHSRCTEGTICDPSKCHPLRVQRRARAPSARRSLQALGQTRHVALLRRGAGSTTLLPSTFRGTTASCRFPSSPWHSRGWQRPPSCPPQESGASPYAEAERSPTG